MNIKSSDHSNDLTFNDKSIPSQLNKLQPETYKTSSVSSSSFDEIAKNPEKPFDKQRPVVTFFQEDTDPLFPTNSSSSSSSPIFSEINKVKQVAFRKNISLEEGDKPLLHDNLFNYIPGTYFEIGASLTILETPGQIGDTVDHFSEKVLVILKLIYNSEKGESLVFYNGKEIKLRQFIDEKILKELHPSSDQIGRCTNQELSEDWLNGEGIQWLEKELTIASRGQEYSPHNLLTKMRTISALGSCLYELMSQTNNHHILAELVDKDPLEMNQRYNHIFDKIRHEQFDSPTTRARSERTPIIEGKAMSSVTRSSTKFGGMYQDNSFGVTQEELELKNKYEAAIKEKGLGGIARLGQGIDDLSRPGIISEYGFKNMPKPFKKTEIANLIDRNRFEHGNAVNRWILKGTYTKESWAHDMPAAGSHSGRAVDVFLAIDYLEPSPIAENRDVVDPLALALSAFMNFGGYHSFVEVFPIARAFINDSHFDVRVTEKEKLNIYNDALSAIKRFSPEAGEKVQKFKDAYDQSLNNRS